MKPKTKEERIAEHDRDLTVEQDAQRYLRAHRILTEMRTRYRNGQISGKEYGALRKIATGGDIDGATKALGRILEERMDAMYCAQRI